MKMAVRNRDSDRRSGKRKATPDALRILVVGAGVAGISIARGLLRDGHDVTVFEQRPDMRPGAVR
jgi:NADPH-dependent 2,4-dienoyl-CoA reductase/sulfur reductase-like enzyme